MEQDTFKLTVRPWTKDDLPFAMELKNFAGWNQVEADWLGYLALEPEGCFLAELNGRPAGTATAIRYGTQAGWIGMVLVHPELRRFGIGTALLKHSIGYLEQLGVECIKLDATPMGKKVYVPLGFVDEYELTRYQGVAAEAEADKQAEADRPDRLEMTDRINAASRTADLAISSITEDDLEELIAFDSGYFGVRRGEVLRMLAARDPQYGFRIRRDGRISGYLMAHQGYNAIQLGPWVADSAGEAEMLLQRFLAKADGSKVFLDVVCPNAEGIRLMSKYGFEVQRGFARMYLGGNKHPGRPEGIYGTSGAEKG
jgi:GNAT superfamily N-acetyltransferase